MSSDPTTPIDPVEPGVSREQAEDAVRVLLRWAGEDPTREGLVDTPKRVAKAYRDWFSGYAIDPTEYLARTFEQVCGYDELIVLRDIEYESHCEHHMAPIIGKVHVGYLPDGKVVGISKLARVVEAYARRFQVQEKMTAQIARCIQDVLQPRGVGVVVEGAHECMTTRGIHKRGVSMVTSKMLGTFRDDARTRAEFLQFIDVALAALPATRVGAPPDAPATNGAELDRLRQDVEDAEHARDAANLQRMKVAGQLNTLHKSLAAAAPEVSSGKDAQSDALRRIEWLAQHGGGGDDSAEAVKAAEMDAPMPSRAVLEAVAAGERRFTKPQLEFSIAEAMVLTGWAQTPLELTANGEPWLATLILKNHADA